MTRWLALAVLLSWGLYQAIRVFPFTPNAAKEIDLDSGSSDCKTITAISINVLMQNTNQAAVMGRERYD